jgi:hypothetical protein
MKLIGKRVNIKASAGCYATSGIVRSVCGDTFELDTVDQSGYRRTEYLTRAQFTMRKSESEAS